MHLEYGYIYDPLYIGDFGDNLLYNYFYVMDSNDFDELNVSKLDFNEFTPETGSIFNTAIKIFTFKHNGRNYVAFYVSNNIKLLSNYPVFRFAYKLKGSYSIDYGLHFHDTKNMLYSQGIERNKIGLNCISTTYLMELLANRLEYTLFLSDRGLMHNVEIEDYLSHRSYRKDNIKFPNTGERIAKSTYDAISLTYNRHSQVIRQRKNKLGELYDIRCYCIDAETVFIIVKDKIKGKTYCVDIQNRKSNASSEDIIKKIIKNSEEIKKVCKKTFNAMNRLIHYRMLKLKYELDSAEYIVGDLENNNSKITPRDKKTVLYILTSLDNDRKNAVIAYINGSYGKSIDPNSFNRPVLEYSEKLDNYPIYDHFMRIDIFLPDDKAYDKVSVCNIEPFSMVKDKFSKIKSCLGDGDKFISTSQYILYKIVKSNADFFTDLQEID